MSETQGGAGAGGVRAPLRALVVLGMAAWVVASLRWWQRAWPFTIDDAYISARYAQQWVAGNGLVYNAGERVEGFSNFAWVCLFALLELCGAPLEFGIKVFGLACATATALGMLLLLTRRMHVRAPPLVAAAGLWLGLDPGFAVWTVGGLETPLFAALLMWSLYVWLRDGPLPTAGVVALAILLGVLAWTRPEGPAVAVGLLALTFVLFRDAEERRGRIVACAVALGIVALGFLVRRWYYDAWWPNPYYVKLGGGIEQMREGLSYWLAAVARRGSIVLVAWVLLPLLHRAEDAGTRRAQWTLLLVLAGYSMFIIRSGREPFPFHRFAVPLVPLAVLVGMPWAAAFGAVSPGRRLLAALPPILCMASAPLTAGGHWREMHTLANITRTVSIPFGQWVRDTQGELPASLGVFWAGAMPYAAGPETYALDMGGLCDPHIAHVELPWPERNHGHTKHDFAYVLERQPTYVTDDALHTLDALVDLGGSRQAQHEAHRERFLTEYTRLNDHLFVRIQDDTLSRLERYVRDFPDDTYAREALGAFRVKLTAD